MATHGETMVTENAVGVAAGRATVSMNASGVLSRALITTTATVGRMNRMAEITNRRNLTDDDVHSPAAWNRDLIAAGWIEESVTIWKDPEGNLWRGPYGAWCALQRSEDRKGKDFIDD